MYRYIPILRWKQGERDALGHLPAGAVQDVAPLLIAGDELRVKKQTKKNAAVSGPEFFGHEIHNVWDARPFYLDASAIPPSTQGHHALVTIANACRIIGAHLIPATTLDAPPPYQAAVQTVAQADQRGVALRVSLSEATKAAQWIAAWPIPLKQTDLIVDFRDTVEIILGLGGSLSHAFQNLHGATQWRTVTIAGTSMPENFGGYAAGLHIIPRIEWQIWHQLVGVNLPYRIDYGDYATVPLVVPPEGIRYGFPINVRYTLPADFLICRGVPTRGPAGVEQAVQLVGHANSIVTYANRNAIQCWADSTIDRIAAATESPGGLTKWVTIGVNRHIPLVRLNLP